MRTVSVTLHDSTSQRTRTIRGVRTRITMSERLPDYSMRSAEFTPTKVSWNKLHRLGPEMSRTKSQHGQMLRTDGKDHRHSSMVGLQGRTMVHMAKLGTTQT